MKALIIGNDTYSSCSLAGCCNEAMEVEALLKISADGFPPPKKNLLFHC